MKNEQIDWLEGLWYEVEAWYDAVLIPERLLVPHKPSHKRQRRLTIRRMYTGHSWAEIDASYQQVRSWISGLFIQDDFQEWYFGNPREFAVRMAWQFETFLMWTEGDLKDFVEAVHYFISQTIQAIDDSLSH